MENCLFCRMVRKEITPDIVFESEEVLAFRDIQPKAPQHVLIIPREHITNVNEARAEQAAALGALFVAAAQIAAELGLSETGYRLVVNTNADAGQSVFHLHMHLLGGAPMGWPPFPAGD